MLAMLKSPAEYDAAELHHAIAVSVCVCVCESEQERHVLLWVLSRDDVCLCSCVSFPLSVQ